MSFFSELRRRNVFRVAVAYLAGAWLVTEVAGTVLPAFGYGDSELRVIILILAISLVPVLVFSWVFEITPEGLKREVDVDREQSITRFTGRKIDRIILVLLALALGYFLFDRLVMMPAREAVIVEQARDEGAELAREQARLDLEPDQSIAVLPFTNLSALESDRYFADGLHDELLTLLGRIGSLRVISRASVMPYRDRTTPLPEIARDLSVATVLEGSVQRAGDQVRIIVQLIDAHADKHLWAETYDRELSAENLFAIQSEVTARIAEALEIRLSREEQGFLIDRPTESLDAYEDYLYGRQLLASRQTESLRKALGAFEQAVAIDPGFAQAWVGIANALMLLQDQSALGPTADAQVRGAIERALSLNDQLGEAYATLAMYYWWDDDIEKSVAAFKKAIELNPNDAMAYMWYANSQSGVQKLEEKLAIYLKAAELDPLSSVIRSNIAGTLGALGREDEAIEQYQRLIELDPDFSHAYIEIGGMHAESGRLAEALRWFRRALEFDPDSGAALMRLANVYISLDDFESLSGIIEQMNDRLAPDTFRLMFLEWYWRLTHSGWRDALMLDDLPAVWEGHPRILGGRALAYLIGRDFENAYLQWVEMEPRWLDRAQWPTLIEENDGGCWTAGIFIAAGEEELGKALLNRSLEYLQFELPKYVEHTDRYADHGLCLLIAGEAEAALDFWQRFVKHGHWGNVRWCYIRFLPWWDVVADDPRYHSILEYVEQQKDLQRELIRQADSTSTDPVDQKE